jgi:hypothetical protein
MSDPFGLTPYEDCLLQDPVGPPAVTVNDVTSWDESRSSGEYLFWWIEKQCIVSYQFVISVAGENCFGDPDTADFMEAKYDKTLGIDASLGLSVSGTGGAPLLKVETEVGVTVTHSLRTCFKMASA